ncbi:hypothetical protein CkaCkLH20_13198 [Colletotrichum karsti]|uniref:Flap endonuclease GEN-like protein 1 n=1 Tax=Colletotrichum karsti TaxID=1095194 RepID=A0A9P6HW31_9PEZI|nr:uncharacterized protein CkaCkLH20_13198 [Colletotrichum karsti]KAF9869331.1 hypothetical protein CkaCkLH20_13198 [Colletotrichum karsti]
MTIKEFISQSTMGIKGIYRELGPGQRISLAKLATDHLESTGQPLRLAIDIAIWQFQTQAARGGTNPAIRTLFYRLVRLLGLAIHPIFVFDGPHKPAFKRNKRSGRGDGVATAMAKRLIRLFGFPVHDSPGEAEAECALLQQHGIVDAVLSEDVDTIMFGCTRTLRNWTSEGTRGAKTPTHVSMYDVEELLSAGTGLDREGMVLVALMSGGDYIPEGVPGCGVKLACEAAKAGFGKSLCRLKIDDSTQFEDWKTILKLELRTNDSGFFRTKHKALSIPEEFPNRQVLRHYTHPVVSNADTIDRLKTTVKWNRPIDVQGLRYFVDETFDWVNKIGAIKLTRVLSQGLLVHKLLERYQSGRSNRSIEQTELEEAALIKRISGIRSHHSTDGTPELRVVHIPADTVGLDMSQELEETVPFDRQGLALNSDDEYKGVADCDIDDSGDKAKARNTFDPLVAESIWLPETLLKLSVPLVVEDWEEKQRTKVSTRTGKGSKKKASKPAQERGALDKWVQITKSTANMATTSKSTRAQDSAVDSHSLAPFGAKPRSSGHVELAPAAPLRPSPVRSSVTRSKQSRSNGKATAAEPTGHKNPWAFAGSQHMPRITKSQQSSEPILLSSSPLRSSPAPSSACLVFGLKSSAIRMQWSGGELSSSAPSYPAKEQITHEANADGFLHHKSLPSTANTGGYFGITE